MINRDDKLKGYTKCIVVNDDIRVYLTLNFQDDEPFEIFIRCDRPELYEWITLSTILITRLLREGTPIEIIVKELQDVHSAGVTNHMLSDGKGNQYGFANW